MEQALRDYAERVRQMISMSTGEPADFDVKALLWLEDSIDRNRAATPPEAIDRFIGMFGCFLGECCIRSYGGKWELYNGTWHVAYETGTKANPMGKVAKRFSGEIGESLVGFHKTLGVMLRNPAEFRGGASRTNPGQ